ncbi:MAG: SUMF1/EgtB/PvdO family nonheme iron enzyme [Candidatus Zhuqueibacterota bacterium]
MVNIFISYARENIEITKKIESELGTDHTIFFDLKILHPGDAFRVIIFNYIRKCDVLILLWSEDAKRSSFVKEELNSALENKMKIIPVLVDQIELPTVIAHLQWIKLNDDNLINALKKTLKNFEAELNVPKSDRQGEPVPIDFADIPSGNFRFSKTKRYEQIEKFQLAIFPITVREYRRFARFDFNEVSREEDHPVTNISWDQAVKFCEWVSERKGPKFRLPTEKEWEYAATAGVNKFKYATVNGKFSSEHVNHNGLQCGLTNDSVGLPNPFGILAMSGNIWEWCTDSEDKNTDYHVVKGGSWRDPASACQCSFRLYLHRSHANIYTGFRVMKVIE